jgi:hypothetical protein
MEILIVVIRTGGYQKKKVPTGLGLSELTYFWYIILQAEIDEDIINIQGRS